MSLRSYQPSAVIVTTRSDHSQEDDIKTNCPTKIVSPDCSGSEWELIFKVPRWPKTHGRHISFNIDIIHQPHSFFKKRALWNNKHELPYHTTVRAPKTSLCNLKTVTHPKTLFVFSISKLNNFPLWYLFYSTHANTKL